MPHRLAYSTQTTSLKADVPENIESLLRRTRILGSLALGAVAVSAAGLLALSMWGEQEVWLARRVSRITRESMTLATDRQTALRGYALSRDPRFLAPEHAARPQLREKLDSLIVLTAAVPSEHRRAVAFRDAITRWERDYGMLLTHGIVAPAALLQRATIDKARFDEVRRAYQGLLRAEELRYEQRVRWSRILRWVTLAALLAEIVGLAMLLAKLARRTERQMRQLGEQQVVLEEQAAELEHSVDQLRVAGDELESANESLRGEMESRMKAQEAAGRAEHRRAEVSARLEHVLESAPLALALHDNACRYERVNLAYTSITGRKPADFVGRMPAEMDVDPDRGAEVQRLIAEVIASGTAVLNLEIETHHEGPESRSWLGSIHPVRLDGVTITGAVAVVVETTEHRRLERQFLQAQKMEAIGQLAGGVAHDFNNLLTAIISYSDLVLDSLPPEDESRQDVGEIRHAAERAAVLTRQLLAVSRQQLVKPQSVRLNDVIHSMESMIRRLLPEDIELRLGLAEDLAPVEADPGQLEQVLLNLAVNARDAMPDGGIINVETANVMLTDVELQHRDGTSVKGGAYVMLSVSDTGIGMDDATQARILEPFFTTKELGRGTGLGLATVYGIVKQSDGFIWVYSEPGHGTVFKIHLPQSSVEHGSDAPAPAAVTRGGSERILLAEDDPIVAAVVRRALERLGYDVLEASDGESALSIFRLESHTIDLVITDIVMPQMSGSALVTELRRIAPDVRVLFMSGYSRDVIERRRIFDLGDAFLEKPFALDTLARKVREALAAAVTR